jgi:hypothetical protein
MFYYICTHAISNSIIECKYVYVILYALSYSIFVIAIIIITYTISMP